MRYALAILLLGVAQAQTIIAPNPGNPIQLFAVGGVNGIVYQGANGPTATATGGAGTLCLVSTNGGVPAFGACSGSAATALSSITAPTANTSIAVGAFTTTFTVGTGTGTNFGFLFQDTTGNTGTGALLQVNSIGTSSMVPFQATAKGTANGIQLSTAGLLQAIGSGGIKATAMPFSGLTAATVTSQALLMGAGSSLGRTGGGTIDASTVLGVTPLLPANNLSDVASAPTSRTNLGLGTAATQNTGTSGANLGLLNANLTFSGTLNLSGLTASRILALDSSNNIATPTSPTCGTYFSGCGGSASFGSMTDFQPTLTSSTVVTVAAGLYSVGNAQYPYSGSSTFTLTPLSMTSITPGSTTIYNFSGVPINTVHFGDTFNVTGVTGTGCSGLNSLQTVVGVGSTSVTTSLNSAGCTSPSGGTFGSNASAAGTAYVYADYAGQLTIMMPSGAGLLVAADTNPPVPVTIQQASPGYQPGSMAVAKVTIASGAFSAVTDQRSFNAQFYVLPSTGLLINEAAGVFTAGIDPTVVPELGAGNIWTGANDFSNASSTAPMRVAGSDPATCTVGQFYYNNSGSPATKVCSATNTWTAIGGGGFDWTKDLPAGTYPVSCAAWTQFAASASCYDDSSNNQHGFIAMPNTGSPSAQSEIFQVPTGWPGTNIDVSLTVGAEATGSGRMKIQSLCLSAGSTFDPIGGSFNAAQNTTTATWGSSLTMQFLTLTGLTTTGCAAGNSMIIQVTRDNTVGSNVAANLDIQDVSVRFH